MVEIIKAEIYKFKKSGIFKYILIASILTILFTVNLFQGTLELIESGYSMNRWNTILLYELGHQFLIHGLILIMIYDMVFKEKNTGYRNMLEIRLDSNGLFIAKLIPTVFYSLLIILMTIIVNCISYTIVSSKSSYLSGKLVDNNLNTELSALQIGILVIVTFGIFFPTIILFISRKFSNLKTIILTAIILMLERFFSNIHIIKEYIPWSYIKKAKYIMTIKDQGIIWKPYLIMAIVLLGIIIFSLFRIGNKTNSN